MKKLNGHMNTILMKSTILNLKAKINIAFIRWRFHLAILIKNYCQFLVNAAVAKSNIGSATSDIWALYAIIQIYQSMLKLKGVDDIAYQKYIHSVLV